MGALLIFILVLVLLYFLWDTSKYYGLRGSSRSAKKATKDIKKEQSIVANRNTVIRLMQMFSWLDRNYGFKRKRYGQEMLSNKIKRLEMKVPYLNRHLKTEELSGILKVFSIVGIVCVILGYVVTGSPFVLLFALLLLSTTTFHWITDFIIYDEDTKLERDFPEFYFVIHNKLMSNNQGRLAPTVKDFIDARNTSYHKKEMRVILAFATDFLHFLELYMDDSMAIQELRKKYSSTTFINFSNLAVQRLQGVDNRDKLLNYSIELQRKNNEKIDKKATKALKKGNMAVMLVLVILVKYIFFMIWLKIEVMMGF